MDRVDADRVDAIVAERAIGSPDTPAARPRTISSRPAPPASTTPASRSMSSSSGVRATASSPRRDDSAQERRRRRAPAPPAARPPRPSRGSPSGSSPRPGSRSARVRGVARRPERTREPGASSRSCSPATSAKPRTICERMTPGVAARAEQRSTGDLLSRASRADRRPSSRAPSTTARAVSVRFVPVSPSGTG